MRKSCKIRQNMISNMQIRMEAGRNASKPAAPTLGHEQHMRVNAGFQTFLNRFFIAIL